MYRWGGLQSLCKENNISISEEVDKISEGWVEKPKGMLQILFERRWIDPSKDRKYYTKSGKKDMYGVTDNQLSLESLLSNCDDFRNELSMLLWFGMEMGITVDHTPICHAELSGEGIEYVWGLAKNHYQHQPLGEKRKKESFKELVRKCLSTTYLTKERVRHCSKWARSFVCAYFKHHFCAENIIDSTIDQTMPVPVQIEKMAKQFKTHRSAIDFNFRFMSHLVKSTTSVEGWYQVGGLIEG